MLAQFSVFPVGSGEALAKDVARIIGIIDKSGLPYKTSAMSTIVEGGCDEIFELVKKCHKSMKRNNNRVYTSMVLDDRKGARNRLTGKVEDIEKLLKRKIKK